MKILLLPNWKIEYGDKPNSSYMPSDYCCDDRFWFFKYFESDITVDVVDTRSIEWIENFEKNKLRIYIMQTIKVLPKLKQYDLIVSHGTTSGIFLAFLHRLLHLKMPPHIIVDISSFHKASEKGFIFKLCQYASKSIDGLIYHTSKQKEYFDKFFPWLKDKYQFINFGVDYDYWNEKQYPNTSQKNQYVVCVGYRKRDWETLIKAYERCETDYKLILIGNENISSSAENIVSLPFMPVEECMTYISNALFCILPLDYMNYSFGQMTILQQMALGKVVLAADVPSIADYESEGIVKYKAGDADDLLKKLNSLFDNKEDLDRLGKENARSIQMKYSEKVMAEKIEVFVNEIINRN